jgi:hypothetical protein
MLATMLAGCAVFLLSRFLPLEFVSGPLLSLHDEMDARFLSVW